MKYRLRKNILLVLASVLTTIAFLIEIPIQHLADEQVAGDLYDRIARALKVLTRSLPADPLMLTLLFFGLFGIYKCFLFCKKRAVSEYLLAAFLSAMLLASRATQTTGMVSIIWANSTQIIKAFLIWNGYCLFWLSIFQIMHQMMEKLCSQDSFQFCKPFLFPWLLLLGAWFPHALIRYPGAVVFDTIHQLREFFGDLPYAAMNPPVHTAILGALVTLGDWLGYAHFGMFLIIIMQMIAMASILAWFLCILQRLKMPAPLIWTLLGIFLFSPIYSAYVTTVLKDSACSIAVTLLLVQTMLLVLVPNMFWEHRGRNIFLWSIAGYLTILMRKNGIAMAAPSMVLVGLYIFVTARMRKAVNAWLPLVCSIVVIALSSATTQWITTSYQVGGGSIREIMSIPFQQTARTLREHNIPQEEAEIIDEILDAELIPQVYEAHISDNVKNTFREDATQEEMFSYTKLWLKHMKDYPSSYIDAFFGMTHAIFSPSAVTDNFYDILVNDSIHQGEWNTAQWRDASPFSVLRKPLDSFYHLMLRLPFVSLITNLGAHVVLIMMLLCCLKKQAGVWLICMPVLMCLVMLLFSPLTCTRYALPVFYGVPVLASACIYLQKQSQAQAC